MAIPITVDTFEHDIADEIRHKEASIEDIAAATGDIKNTPTEETNVKSNSAVISIVVILILCGIIGASYLGYIYFVDGPTSIAKKEEVIKSQNKKLNPEIQLSFVSPALDKALGTLLTNIEKSPAGYSMNVVSYSPVFAYMIKNEKDFGDDLGILVGNSHTVKANATSTPKVTPVIIVATTTSTSTQNIGTTTSTINATTTETEPELSTSYIFSDVTISNQNMRTATSIYGTVVYAFIGTQKLVISSSTAGILQLRSSLLHK